MFWRRVEITAKLLADAVRFATLSRAAKQQPGRHLILLARNLPPMVHGGVYRLGSIVRMAVDAGWRVSVVTNEPHGSLSDAGFELAAKMPEQAKLYRWRAGDEDRNHFWNISPGVSGGFSSIRRIVDEASLLLTASPEAVIVASGPTYAEFIAAYVLARKFGVPYVLDYRDEWTGSDFGFVERGHTDRFWERRCCADAARIVFATDGIRRHHHHATFPNLRTTLSTTIRNGWDTLPAVDSTLADTTETSSVRDLVVGYFGFILPEMEFGEFARTLSIALTRDPVLAARFSLNIYGRMIPHDIAVARALMSDDEQFHFGGLVPQSIAVAKMAQCSALLLLNSPATHLAIPGKTYDYIASRRPVLLYGEGGETDEILRPLGGVVRVPRGDPAALAVALHEILAGHAERQAVQSGPAYANSLRRSERNAEWLEVLESLL